MWTPLTAEGYDRLAQRPSRKAVGMWSRSLDRVGHPLQRSLRRVGYNWGRNAEGISFVMFKFAFNSNKGEGNVGGKVTVTHFRTCQTAQSAQGNCIKQARVTDVSTAQCAPGCMDWVHFLAVTVNPFGLISRSCEA